MDLDDHLYLLEDAFGKLSMGEGAHIKPLAAELRVLVCKSSRTEGLLWKIVDMLSVPDNVNIHQPLGKLERDHPLS